MAEELALLSVHTGPHYYYDYEQGTDSGDCLITHLVRSIVGALRRGQGTSWLRALLWNDARIDPGTDAVVLVHARNEAHVGGGRILARIEHVRGLLRCRSRRRCCVCVLRHERRHVLRQWGAIRLARRASIGSRAE